MPRVQQPQTGKTAQRAGVADHQLRLIARFLSRRHLWQASMCPWLHVRQLTSLPNFAPKVHLMGHFWAKCLTSRPFFLFAT